MNRLLSLFLVLLAAALFTRVDYFFFLLYALFGIYFVGRFWARRSVAAVQLHRRHEQRVFLGESLPIQVDVHNRGWLPVLWLQISDGVPAEINPGPAFRQVLSLLPRERRTLRYTLIGHRRGYYRLGPFDALGGDLLGSVTYEHRYNGDDFLIVYPKIVALRTLGLPSQSPFGTLPSRERLFEDPTRIHGVRAYQPGDPLHRIDWKTSARVGAYQVRRYEPAISLQTALFLNLRLEDYSQRSRFQATELGITVASSLAVHLTEKRQAVGLVTNGCDPLDDAGSEAKPLGNTPSLPPRKGREHLLHILDLLARIGVSSEEGTTPFAQILSQQSLGLPWGSTVVAITATEAPGLLDTLLALRRRGLFVVLVLTDPQPGFDSVARRAEQIGVQAVRIWSERDLDIWR